MSQPTPDNNRKNQNRRDTALLDSPYEPQHRVAVRIPEGFERIIAGFSQTGDLAYAPADRVNGVPGVPGVPGSRVLFRSPRAALPITCFA